MSAQTFIRNFTLLLAFCLVITFAGHAQVVADAGPNNAEVCEGDGIVLGGEPTASGGSGFYSISWTSNPGGFSSNDSNPVVNPEEDTDYIVTVTDSDMNIDIDVISVTVNPRTDPSDLDIILNPDANSYSVEDAPVNLSYTVGGGGSGSGVLSGDGVNGTSNQFFPNSANVGPNDITLTFTNDDGCVTEITETVNVYNPNGFVSGLDASYCPYGDDDLTINVPSPYLSLVDVAIADKMGANIPAGTAWTKNIPARTVHLNLDLLPIGKNAMYITYTILGIIGYNYTPYLDPSCLCIRYIITPILGPVQTNVVVPLTINRQPDVKIAFKAKVPEFCRNDAPVVMEGGPAGGIWQGVGITPSPGNNASPEYSSGDNGLASFDPQAGTIGNNAIRYVYEDAAGCLDTARVDFTVFALPQLDFTAGNGCVGIPMEFNPTVAIPGGVSVTGYTWNFDDDNREDYPVLSDPTTHTYSSSNDYDVTFGASTADGCFASVTHQISVGDIPDVNLRWSSVCDGDPTRFAFKSSYFSNNPADLQNVFWEFGDGSGAAKANPSLADTIRQYTYAAPGTYEAIVTLETDLGCTNADTVQLYKVIRTGPIDGENEYLQTFNGLTADEQEWVSGGTNSSWEWGVPSKTLVTDDSPGGGKAWMTSLTGSFNINEDSWVHSPCIDLSQIQRPVLSLDIRSLTRSRIEGAVLQVNVTTSTDKESDWTTVGNLSTGTNWYNANGIFSNPGNQPLNQTGWSGSLDSSSWRTAVVALDNTLASLTPAERGRMRFRVAFASPIDSSFISTEEGFAFDNFKITQRNRVVLLETFTNTGGLNTPDDPNKMTNVALNNFVSGLNDEIAKIEYHLSVAGPNDDPVYLDNPVDANARAAFYGITSTPFAMVDGTYGSSLQNIYAAQTLKPAEARIDNILTSGAPGGALNVEVTFTANTDLPPGTVLHVVAMEKIITAPEAMGSNGESSFSYVMKKMLPTARGTIYPLGVPKLESRTVNVSWWPKAYDLSNLVIIAFLQHEETGAVFQARLLDSPQYLPTDVVTGIETDLADRVRVYPVPADRELLVRLPAALPHAVVCSMIDQFGREIIRRTFHAGEQTKRFDTADLSDGVYILQFETPEERVSRKKLLVVHGQGR